MEVAKLLEADSRKGRIWLIDSSPEFLKDVTRFSLLSSPEDIQNQVQVKIITRFLDLIWPQASKEVCSIIFVISYTSAAYSAESVFKIGYYQ